MPHEKKFKNKVVVITGASAGIGRAIAIAFAKQGAHIAGIARNKERLLALKSDLQQYGTKFLALAIDVANAKALEDAAVIIEREIGPINIWVNNAMVSVFSPVREMAAYEYRRVTEVTYLGAVYGTLTALKRMLPRNAGTIIQIGSALAYRGIPLQSAYCGAKHALQGFHDSLLTELLHDKSAVKVTMVQLSAHNTPQFDWVRSRLKNKAQPVPPIYQPEIAANAVLWAALHYKREYVVGFPAWKAIYGNMLFPSLGDRVLANTGYQKQQTGERRKIDQPDNLFRAASGSFGMHGRFDNEAKEHDLFFEFTKYIPFNKVLITLLLMILLFIIVKI